MNSDLVYVASSICSTCNAKFYQQSSSNTSRVMGNLSIVNTDFYNLTEEYSNLSFSGLLVKDKFCLKGAFDKTCPQALSNPLTFLMV